MVIRVTGSRRVVLWCVSAVGLFGVNGLFLYAALLRPETMAEAWTNPLAAAFLLEALVLLPLLCLLVAAADLESPGWLGFLVLSLVGSLAFSIPFSVLRWTRERGDSS